MKKKIVISLSLVCTIVFGIVLAGMNSKASGADVNISIDQQTVKKEQEFSVQVKISSNAQMQSIDAMVSYDAQILEFISSDNTAANGASGLLHIKEEFLDGTVEAVYNLTFKALETGAATISVYDTLIEESETFALVDVVNRQLTIEVATNRSESAECHLSNLLIAPGQLNQEFNPEVYEYTAEVPYENDAVAISAIPADENAVVTMEKPDILEFGNNLVTITVTAVSGNTATYTININRSSVPSETGIVVEEAQTDESDTTVETEALADTLIIDEN